MRFRLRSIFRRLPDMGFRGFLVWGAMRKEKRRRRGDETLRRRLGV